MRGELLSADALTHAYMCRDTEDLESHINALTSMVVDQQRTITELQAALQDRNNLARETADARDNLAAAEKEMARYKPVCDAARDWVIAREAADAADLPLSHYEQNLANTVDDWWQTS